MPWDKEREYDEHIAPLMTKIIALCKKYEIPMVADFQYCDREDDGPGFCTTALAAFPHAHDKMRRLAAMARPERPVCLAETAVTKQDGSKEITIRRV